ncbi:interleukin-13 receptor subunit alpha-1 [Hoplias malabaricus]|uniref:interleukin-13 receptor subunit alpha-1 n=1 Tax=Hoplias malabaricus TaxID=27720 RepID=UPI003462806D
MIFGYWDFHFIICFSLVFLTDAVPDELPQPENLTLSWSTKRFSVTTNWNKPSGLEADCTVLYEIHFYSEKCPPNAAAVEKWRVKNVNHWWYTDVNEVCVSITTIPDKCGNKTQSKSLLKDLSRPQGVVKDFTCVYYSDKKMNCTWTIISNASNLQLFYGTNPTNLKPCVSYNDTGSTRTGCYLHDEKFLEGDTFFIVNGTLKGLPIQSNFIRKISNFVKIMPPKIRITRNGTLLRFQSSPPGFNKHCWNYEYLYRKCDEDAKNLRGDDDWSASVDYDEACRYTVQVQATYNCGKGNSSMSLPEYYGENRDLNWSLKVTSIVIPIVVSCCLIVALVLIRRHKDYLFPKIPEPSAMFKDMFNGNKDKGLEDAKLYVPTEDMVEKKISLEPEITFLHIEP